MKEARGKRLPAVCFIYMTFWNRPNYKGKKSDQWLPLANGGVKEYKGTFKVVEMFYTPIYMNVDI